MLKKLFILTFFGALCAIAHAQYDRHSNTIDMTDYVSPGDTDNTMAVVRALNDCRRYKAHKLVFPKGIYRFRPDSLKRS